MANDGNVRSIYLKLYGRQRLILNLPFQHRELRYFQPFQPHQVETFRLPEMFHEIQGSEECPIGDAIISTRDTMLGFETCEEMWTPRAPHLDLSLAGCEIIVNSSASHFSLRKIEIRYALLLEASRKCGGIYL
jgi:NAD+ synthase (glutamine-hydrolysing)